MQVVGSLQGFRPLASSREVELPHSAPIAVKLTGNILQVPSFIAIEVEETNLTHLSQLSGAAIPARQAT
jgi:hypothetical protein